jgi:hypothetical protein
VIDYSVVSAFAKGTAMVTDKFNRIILLSHLHAKEKSKSADYAALCTSKSFPTKVIPIVASTLGGFGKRAKDFWDVTSDRLQNPSQCSWCANMSTLTL